MLTCSIVAGALFLATDADASLRRFDSAEIIDLVQRDGEPVLTVTYSDIKANYRIPDQWHGLSADGVVNACEEEAWAKITPDGEKDTTPTLAIPASAET
ncbi:hypothetical protein ACEUZ9_000969 [Paracoccus litorisediminis]|uniref:hypothetical protein n=1 Tax=Paracoccus litorisediminis TaxID=2006130 RepID=UPI0037324140